MQSLSKKDDQAGLLYDGNLKKALQKTKFIEKRIEERGQAMKRKLADLKSVCRLICNQQIFLQPQSPDLPSLDSKVFTKSSDESACHDKDDESAKEENIKISKAEAKLQNTQQKNNEATKKQAKLEYQPQNPTFEQNVLQVASTVIHSKFEVKKEYEPQRVDMSVVQRSENSTAKFVDSERESSMILKGQYGGQDQSFIGQNQELQKTKNTNSFQSSIDDKNLVHFNVESNSKTGPFGLLLSQPTIQNLSFFNPQIFSFSSIPQNQVVNVEPTLNWQTQKVQKTFNNTSQIFENKDINKENISTQNLTTVQVKVQQKDQPMDRQSEKLQNEGNLLKSVDRSMAESAEEKSLSFNLINDQLDNFLKVNSSQEISNKQPQPQTQILNEPVKQPAKIDLTTLRVNPNFVFNNATNSVPKIMPKTKNRMFKGKGRRKDSSDNDSD